MNTLVNAEMMRIMGSDTEMEKIPLFKRAAVWAVDRLRHWLFVVDSASLELFAAVEAVVLGCFLLTPLPTFRSSVTFSFVGRIAPEETWGMVLLAIGMIQITALNSNNHPLRQTMSLVTAMLYGIWGAGLIISNISSTGTITYPLLAIAMIWAHVGNDVRGHARVTDR